MNQMMAIRNAFANPAAASRQAMYIQSARDNALARARRPLSPEEQALQEMDPVDAYKLSQELMNKQTVSPEQAAANQKQNARDLLSIIPGPGNVIAAEDAVTGAGNALSAVREGAYGRAALEGGLALLSGVGAVTGLPTGRIAGDAARGAKDSLSAFPAYHGSPHDFDEFKLDKIGTGEGAQAYGHGLYFAESPEVAKRYQEALSTGNFYAKQLRHVRAELDNAMESAGKNWLGKQKITPEIRELQEKVARHEAVVKDQSGKIYKVDIDEEPEHLLDWDKPLSEQGEVGAKALSVFERMGFTSDPGRTLGDIKQIANERYGPGTFQQAQVSQALREAGIPGIRYLDQGSREAGGTSNYVIFDSARTKILSKE